MSEPEATNTHSRKAKKQNKVPTNDSADGRDVPAARRSALSLAFTSVFAAICDAVTTACTHTQHTHYTWTTPHDTHIHDSRFHTFFCCYAHFSPRHQQMRRRQACPTSPGRQTSLLSLTSPCLFFFLFFYLCDYSCTSLVLFLYLCFFFTGHFADRLFYSLTNVHYYWSFFLFISPCSKFTAICFSLTFFLKKKFFSRTVLLDI